MLEIESELKARLVAKVTAAKKVYSAADLADVQESQQLTPALHVIPDGYTVTAVGPGSQKTVKLTETWLVIVAVRNVNTTSTGEDARTAAGPILTKVFQALAGWKPTIACNPMVAASPPSPGFTSGFGYFPTAWTLTYSLRGDGNG